MTDFTAIVPALAEGEGGFELTDLEVRDGEVVVSLRRSSGDGELTLVVGPSGDARAVWRGERCTVRYVTALRLISPAERDAVLSLIEAIGGGIDRWLVAHPDAGPAEALAALSVGPSRVAFTPDGVLVLLGLHADAELPGGWRLAGIYPSSMTDGDGARRALVIELAHPADGAVRLELGPRNDAARAFTRSAHLDLSYLTLGSEPPASAARAIRLLGILLRLRDTADVEIDLEAAAHTRLRLGVGAVPALAPTTRAAEWLNLAINSACGQACQFCSIQDVSPPWSDDRRHERLLLDLESNRQAGVRRVRLNGYDPLTYPRILELARAVRDLGYEEVNVFSPCTVLADAAVLDALLGALPELTSFHVPVYGPTAEVHDRVVGRPGAFERVALALALLGERLPRDRIVVTSVAVEDNLDHLIELRAWALERAIRLHVQTPYPSSESRTDRYRASAASFRAIARATMREDGEVLIVNGVPPCVYFARSAELGLDVRAWLDGEAHPLPGREYLVDAFSHRALVVPHSVWVPAAVPCPHREECALATACPREVLDSYVEKHGLEELAPVGLRSLLG